MREKQALNHLTIDPKMLYKVFSWITTLIFMFFFALAMLLTELFARIAFLFGERVHQYVMNMLQLVIIRLLGICGMYFKADKGKWQLPKAGTRSLILVSNHQAIFDIPFKFWHFRRYSTKFVAKKELSKNVPAASYHLHHGGHALIDRKDKNQALEAIAEMGRKAEKKRNAAVIYPEGSRSRNGKLRDFKLAGLAKLLETMPSALVVPIAIEGSWELLKYNFAPIPFGVRCKMTVLEPIEPQGLSPQDVLNYCEKQIRRQIGQEVTSTVEAIQ